MKASIAAMITLAMALISMEASAQTLQASQALMADQTVYSGNGKYRLTLQASDGNLVVYRVSDNAAIWATGVLGTVGGNTGALMQLDRNFVVYGDLTSAASARWSSATSVPFVDTAAYLELGNNGSLAIYSGAGQKVWSTPADACPNGGHLSWYQMCLYAGTPLQRNTSEAACSWSDAYHRALSTGGHLGYCL